MNQPMSIGALLAFLNQGKMPAAQAPSLQSLMTPAPQTDPATMKANRDAAMYQDMASKADQIYGTAPVPQQTAPYQMGEEEMFPGEAPIQGLQDITQEAQPATGMFDQSIPLRQRILEMNKRMLQSGNRGFGEQWARNQSAMQGSNMSNLGAMERAKYQAANKRSNAALMANELGYKQGTPEYNEFIESVALKTDTVNPDDVPLKTGDMSKWMTNDGKPVTYLTPGMIKQGGYKLRDSVSSDAGGRLAMLEDAEQGFKEIENLMYTEGGEIDRDVVQGMLVKNVFGMLGELGDVAGNYLTSDTSQQVGNAFERGIQAITRIETGAAMPAEELGNTRRRFQPQVGESDATINQKYAAYKHFIQHAQEIIDPIRNTNPNISQAELINAAIDRSFAAVGSTTPTAPKTEVDDPAPTGYKWAEE